MKKRKIKYSAIFFLCWFALFGLTGGWSPEVPNSSMVMDLQGFFISLLNVVCEMAPYLLLGFFVAGVLHVFVPQKFYANYLSRNNKFSVLWAALLGIPLPLCSCGVIPTAIGLRNEKASKGADGHRFHSGHVLADGAGICDYPSYSSTHHGCLWRFVGKPTGSRG